LKIITIVTRYADKRLEEFWKNLWRNDETLSARERKLTRLLTHVYIHQPCIPNVEGDLKASMKHDKNQKTGKKNQRGAEKYQGTS